ncbi:tRNA lysidine(34) synthetase TilS [Luteimonas sp. MJ204]|uniref:tRNA lysidine(34) synthetase TilS n=1 Tax=Luteimonas sp. MJ145 TaxID=3129234 RepID=UPI0031BA5625
MNPDPPDAIRLERLLPEHLLRVPDDDAGTAITVALSGGLDSSVLLHRLAALPTVRARGLRALHVHHGLHRDADAWAAHCSATCAALGVPLAVQRVAVARDSGLGLEGAARAARHAAFARALGKDEVLALAHHQDDQAETFLLRALRASGPDGLAAMRPWRRFAAGWMWRPLLLLPRARLEAWARARKLAWIEDPANADPIHDRTLLRRTVLPLLRQRWPGADTALARSAALCAEAADLLAVHDAAALDGLMARASDGDGGDALPADDERTGDRTRGHRTLPTGPLEALPPAQRARLLRAWVAGLGLPPLPASAIPGIEALLAARGDGAAAYRWSNACVRAWRGRLHAMPLQALAPLEPGWARRWDGRAPLPLPGGGSLALEGAEAFGQPLHAHARRGGERIHLPGRTHSHALKQVLQDAGIAPWQRARMPLLSDAAGRLLAAGDRILDASLHAWLQARGARLRWRDLA